MSDLDDPRIAQAKAAGWRWSPSDQLWSHKDRPHDLRTTDRLPVSEAIPVSQLRPSEAAMKAIRRIMPTEHEALLVTYAALIDQEFPQAPASAAVAEGLSKENAELLKHIQDLKADEIIAKILAERPEALAQAGRAEAKPTHDWALQASEEVVATLQADYPFGESLEDWPVRTLAEIIRKHAETPAV